MRQIVGGLTRWRGGGVGGLTAAWAGLKAWRLRSSEREDERVSDCEIDRVRKIGLGFLLKGFSGVLFGFQVKPKPDWF